ncbi:MAG: acetyl-CoA carboxylase biotin carboxylase subunit [Pseudomonadota bacterium]
MTRLNRILIANRGEIACRIMRTIRSLGRESVAVYSSADEHALHRELADLSIAIGGAAASDSYLNITRIIDAARETGADAIHPGYGFVSENAAMATACGEAGITFIGPPADAIAVMGNKAAAKARMLSAGVPCVPGYQGDDQSDEHLISRADDIGFPIMVKAAAGGGGRGMRLVVSRDDLPDALRIARSESLAAFGDERLILERAIVSARHVEIQVLADQQGNVIHLGERDCSIQRRHQKIIEEAPCPVVDSSLREAMGQAAVAAARDIDYVGAGTVEFLLDAEGEFYFLEMNTRLQVEHPVTEAITGLDLVALQIAIAEGAPLPITQDAVQINGHAIEARLYAEDPEDGFMPQAGPVKFWRAPSTTLARTDSGIKTGNEISPFYDPMVAKIVCHGVTREDARTKLQQALGETTLLGTKTNRQFLLSALADRTFAAGDATTQFIESQMTEIRDSDAPSTAALATIASSLEQQRRYRHTMNTELLAWRHDANAESRFDYLTTDGTASVTMSWRSATDFEIDGVAITLTRHEEQHLDLVVAGEPVSFDYLMTDQAVWLSGTTFEATFTRPTGRHDSPSSGGSDTVVAPFHGRIVACFVETGEAVNAGQKLVVVEAMKMQHDVVAPRKGVVDQVVVSENDQVAAGSLLLKLESEGG